MNGKNKVGFGLAITAGLLAGVFASIPTFVPRVHAAMWQWSGVASQNASADPSINWREGQSPSSVNDSARAMMAALAAYRDDISGLLATGGTSTAYTVTTNQGLCLSPSTTPQNGQQLSLTMSATNGASPTLQADTCSAYPIQSASGVAVGAGSLVSGSPYTFSFSTTNNAWMLRDFYSTAITVPIGGLVPYTGTTSPNSNFILPAGQCISTTTYAAYWALLGSPGSGSCSGGMFAVIDLRGETLVALDNLNGTAANRLTSSVTGCGTAMTSVGATCANGNQSQTLATANLPPYTPAGSVSTSINMNGSSVFATFGTPLAFGGTNSGASIGTNPSASSSFSGTPQGGTSTPFPRVQPSIAVTYLLRVL